MNRRWNEDCEEPQKSGYECLTCGRIVYTPSGYMPRHRKKGKRAWCNGSESHVSFNRKLEK